MTEINPSSVAHAGIGYGPTHRAHRGLVAEVYSTAGTVTIEDESYATCTIKDERVTDYV